MRILAIDPGPKSSGAVVLHTGLDGSIWPPEILGSWRVASLDTIREWRVKEVDHVVVEGITSYGKIVGRDVFDTSRIIGRIEEIGWWTGRGVALITRPEIGRILCPFAGTGSPSGAQMAAAIRDLYIDAGRANGGGADPVKGTKKQPGPLCGMSLSQHEGSALAVGLAWLIRERGRNE